MLQHTTYRWPQGNINNVTSCITRSSPVGVGRGDSAACSRARGCPVGPVLLRPRIQGPGKLARVATVDPPTGEDDGVVVGARHSTPFPQSQLHGTHPHIQLHSLDPTLPYLLYLPNLDGTGITCKPQWPRMAAHFNLHTLSIPTDNRWSFEQLVQYVKDQLREQLEGSVEPEQTVYLMGEGFGALLALAAAAECSLVNRLVLVSPATAYPSSPMSRVLPIMSRLPPNLHALLASTLAADNPSGLMAALSSSSNGGTATPAQLFSQPLQLFTGLAGRLPLVGQTMKAAVDQLAKGLADLPGQEDTRKALLELLPEVQRLVSSLPPDTLTWRLQVLQEGCSYVDGVVHSVEQRTMIVAGGLDLLMPSVAEGGRLARRLPRAFCSSLPRRSHLLLCEPGFDLLDHMSKEGFYMTERSFTSPPVVSGGKFDGNVRGSLGAAGPVELPCKEEVARYSRMFTTPVRTLSSPVFLSTDSSGRIIEGLGAVPNDQRPILFVGNHQLWAFDMNVLVEELLVQRGLLLRGLAHPALFADNAQNSGEMRDPRMVAHQMSNTFKTFGAVPVSPQGYYRLLQRGEAVLVYPGGVREGFKRRGEKYKLFWPQRAEFVRMAAKFGATVVPIASVGVEDAVTILMDTDEVRDHPLLGRTFREVAALMPEARVGVNDVEEYDQSFISPLVAPSIPARQYYLLRQPIQLDPKDYNDKDKCAHLYAHIKGEVETGIEYLLDKRQQDPYGDLLPRVLYERSPGAGLRRAPFFPLE